MPNNFQHIKANHKTRLQIALKLEMFYLQQMHGGLDLSGKLKLSF